MAKNLSPNGHGRNEPAPEKPYFHRLVNLYKEMEALREDIKVVCTEAREADIRIMPLKLAVKRHLETEKERNARLEKEEEAERILRALGAFVNTPLGQAAVEEAARP
jgi:hypothetical protein